MRQWTGSALVQNWVNIGFWTNAGILSIKPLGTNFSEIRINIQNFSFMKMHVRMSSVCVVCVCGGVNKGGGGGGGGGGTRVLIKGGGRVLIKKGGGRVLIKGTPAGLLSS